MHLQVMVSTSVSKKERVSIRLCGTHFSFLPCNSLDKRSQMDIRIASKKKKENTLIHEIITDRQTSKWRERNAIEILKRCKVDDK